MISGAGIANQSFVNLHMRHSQSSHRTEQTGFLNLTKNFLTSKLLFVFFWNVFLYYGQKSHCCIFQDLKNGPLQQTSWFKVGDYPDVQCTYRVSYEILLLNHRSVAPLRRDKFPFKTKIQAKSRFKIVLTFLPSFAFFWPTMFSFA